MNLERLTREGYAVVEGVLAPGFIERLRAAMYRAQEAIKREIAPARLAAAGEVGVLRLMMRYDPVFFELLRVPQLLELVDGTVSETAIMHLQNGFILPPEPETSGVFQHQFHRDFPRYLNGYVSSVNALFALDDFTPENGATLVIPGSHQQAAPPDDAAKRSAVAVRCKAGAMIAFDSTLWHAAGRNASRADRLALNHQFTRSFIKQQIDYVRALGEPAIVKLPPRTQQLLGYYTRVVTSLDEYYRPEAERLYRKGQG